jgi:branched-chain amino acid transport system substrate-binding protein
MKFFTQTFQRVAIAALGLVLLVSPVTSSAADPYNVYALLPLTGSVSFYAQSQLDSLHALENATNKAGGIGGRPLHFVIQDDQSNPQIDVQLASEIFAKGVPVMLGPTNTAQCNAVSAMVKEKGPVIYCFTPGAHPDAGSYTFAFGASTNYIINASFRYLSMRGLNRVATITSTDASGQDGDRMLTESAGGFKNIQFVGREHFNPTDVTVAAQIARIKAQNPQVLVVWTTGTPFGTILRGIQDAGLDIPIVTSNGNLTWAQMKQYEGILPKELLFQGGPFHAPEQYSDKGMRDAISTFYTELKELGKRPDWGNNNCWDPASILISALKKIGPNATAQQVRDYILGLKNFAGVNGVYDFSGYPQRGLGENGTVMVKWDDAKQNFIAVSRQGGYPLTAAK